MTDAAFLQAITEDPDDDSPRLVYADWLEEHGQPERAEFIRVQIELARMDAKDPRRPELLAREGELLKAHRERWLEPLRLLLVGPRSAGDRLRDRLFRRPRLDLSWYLEHGGWFHRGFLSHLSLPAPGFLAHADALFRDFPLLGDLSLFIESPQEAAALFDSPGLGRLHGLALFDSVVGQEAVGRLATCAYLGRLRKLWISSPLLDAACVRLLADAPLLDRVTDLALFTWRYLGQSEWVWGTLGDEAVQVLAGCPRCDKLEALNLSFNPIGDTGAAALAASPHLVRVRRLGLQGTDISREGMERLRARFGDRVHF